LPEPEFDEVKAFATLITNLGKKKRTENLLKLAEYCVHLKKLYGSWARLAEKIRINDVRPHISPEMLREFGVVVDLPEEVKEMIKNKLITSVDVAYRISRLKNSEDQTLLAKKIIQERLNTSDVRAIVEYKTKNPHVTLEGAAERVIRSKAKVVIRHIAIMELQKDVVNRLRQEAKAMKVNMNDLVLSILRARVKTTFILSFGMRGTDIIMKLSDDGFHAFKKEAQILKVPLKDVANKMIKEALK
jgi:hypothetical protein